MTGRRHIFQPETRIRSLGQSWRTYGQPSYWLPQNGSCPTCSEKRGSVQKGLERVHSQCGGANTQGSHTFYSSGIITWDGSTRGHRAAGHPVRPGCVFSARHRPSRGSRSQGDFSSRHAVGAGLLGVQKKGPTSHTCGKMFKNSGDTAFTHRLNRQPLLEVPGCSSRDREAAGNASQYLLPILPCLLSSGPGSAVEWTGQSQCSASPPPSHLAPCCLGEFHLHRDVYPDPAPDTPSTSDHTKDRSRVSYVRSVSSF